MRFGFGRMGRQHRQRTCCGAVVEEGIRSLLDCEPGDRARVRRIPCSLRCAQRLRELGIGEGAVVTVLRQNDPVLILAMDTRIAIDPWTASMIEIEPDEQD